jgi:hypothetical protein
VARDGGVKPHVAPPPAQPARALVIGEVSVADPLWEPYKLHFTRGAEAWLTVAETTVKWSRGQPIE